MHVQDASGNTVVAAFVVSISATLEGAGLEGTLTVDAPQVQGYLPTGVPRKDHPRGVPRS